MSNLSMLQKQHTEVVEIMNHINILIKKRNLETTAKDIAYYINTLAGKLKMHLMSEDKFLYPNLIRSDNESIRNTAQAFNNEMSDVANTFTSFVQQYNIPTKILQNEENFQSECKKVFTIITSRINKEDSKLYPLLGN